jgi:hypothetical protein
MEASKVEGGVAGWKGLSHVGLKELATEMNCQKLSSDRSSIIRSEKYWW